MQRTIFAILVVVAVSAIQEQDIRDRRQSIDFSFRIGPNDETILVIDDEDIVFLTGSNAMCEQIMDGEMLIYASGMLLIFPGSRIGPFPLISEFRYLVDPDTTVQVTTSSDFKNLMGPGTLFLSTGRAFFTNNSVALEIIAAKATARPLRTNVQVIPDTSEGRLISILDVDSGNFTMRLTGSPTKILDIFTDNRIIYRDNTLMVQQGVLEMTIFPDIFTFAVLRLVPGTSDTQYNVFLSRSPEIIQGPGQVYVGVSENKAFYVEDFSFRTDSSDVSESINKEIFNQAFRINEVTVGEVLVVDASSNELITLSANTSKFDLSNAERVTYIGSQQMLTFHAKGGRIYSFPAIQMFALFDNNTLETFTSFSPATTIFMCTGGTIFVEDVNKRAMFVSNSNPIVISELCDRIPVPDGIVYEYYVATDTEDNRILTVIGRDITTTPATDSEPMNILSVTGLYSTAVAESEVVTFVNNEIIIRDFFDATVGRIGEVDKLFVNTESSAFRSYEKDSPIPFRGPGTLFYSRKNAFFTTDTMLGRDISFQSRIAPIPIIDFEIVPIQKNTIDGVNYTESAIMLEIGGDRVVTYEAESYTTSTDQELLYAENILTLHHPIFTGEGNITYSSNRQTVTYTDASGVERDISGVTTFNTFSGGDVSMIMAPNDVIIHRPGKLYVSEDGSNVLFSSSDIITTEVAAIIRQGATAFSISADQFSSVVDDIFNISTTSATVTYPGGGIIWSSTFNGNRESFYVDDESVSNRIQTDVSVYLSLTTSVPAADRGFIQIIINGRDYYSYYPIAGNSDILLRNTESFVFNDTEITGLSVGQFTGINRLITYDGVEIKNFTSMDTPVTINGYGLLLVQSDSDTAFFTTLPFSIKYLLEAIKNLEDYIIPPEIQPPIVGQMTTKQLFDELRFGTNVRAFTGASITLTCNVVAGRPDPTVEFFRQLEDGSRLPLNNTQMGITVERNSSTEEYSLTISSISSDDSGTYLCRADNKIPPDAEVTSTLVVQEAVAPRVQPGWLPFEGMNNQSIIWPSDPPVTANIQTQVVQQLVFVCRVDGKPKAEVAWRFNELDIEVAVSIGLLDASSVSTEIISSGRSVLIIDVEPNQDIFRGDNDIECFAENEGGSTTGRVNLQGIYYDCMSTGVGECSTTCGLGRREVILSCFIEQGLMPARPIPSVVVPDEALPSNRTQICQVFDSAGEPVICPIIEYRWKTSEWTECTRTCGGGSRNRTVTCVQVTTPLTSSYTAQPDRATEVEVNETMCRCNTWAIKPTSRELCNTEMCPIWKAGEFSECSVTCGTGIQVREVTCNEIVGNYTDKYGELGYNLTVVNDSLCDPEDQPMPSVECRLIRCNYQWRPEPFGECGDVPLADEFPHCRQRGFFCYNGDPNPNIRKRKRIVDDSFCADVTPNVSPLGSCNGGRCFNGIWRHDPWTPCSETCGFGIRTRHVECLSPHSLTLVSNDFCDVATMPDPVGECFLVNCRNECLRDETVLCPLYETLNLCDSPIALGSNGLRCCDTCLGLVEDDEDYY